MSNVINKVLVMIDTESFGLRPDSIMREIAFTAVDMDDPDSVVKEVNEFLPSLPQEALGRKCYVETVAWLLDCAPVTKTAIRENIEGDLDELCAIVRSVIRKFNEVTQNREYEVWFRRPQHDVPMLESLFTMCGERLPWSYDKVNDLATMMNLAGISSKDVVHGNEVAHVALDDCRFQIRCYVEATRRLRVITMAAEGQDVVAQPIRHSKFGVKAAELPLVPDPTTTRFPPQMITQSGSEG